MWGRRSLNNTNGGEDGRVEEPEKGIGPYFLEPSRSQRLERRGALLRHYRNNDVTIEPGWYPQVTENCWIAPSEPDWGRKPYTTPMRELTFLAELNYQVVCLLIASRVAGIYHKSNMSDRPPPRVHPKLLDYCKEWKKQSDELQPIIARQNIIGIENADTDGMKFLVFQTAGLPRDVLEAFLNTVKSDVEFPDTFEAYHPFSYLVVDDPDKPLADYHGCTTLESLDRAGRVSAPEILLGKTLDDMIVIFEKLISPISECRSLIATHCFVLLDDYTDRAGTAYCLENWIAKVVFQRPCGIWQARPITFKAMKKGILKAFEMLVLDLGMLRCDHENIITDEVYGIDVDSVGNAESVYDVRRIQDVLVKS